MLVVTAGIQMATSTVLSVALRLLVRKWHNCERLGTKVGFVASTQGLLNINRQQPISFAVIVLAKNRRLGYEIA
jgi:hypothetical protein